MNPASAPCQVSRSGSDKRSGVRCRFIFLAVALISILAQPACERTAAIMTPPTITGCIVPADAVVGGSQKTGFPNPEASVDASIGTHAGQFWVREGETLNVFLKEFSFHYASGSASTATCIQKPTEGGISCTNEDFPLFHGHYEVQVVRCPGQIMCEPDKAETLSTCQFTNDGPIQDTSCLQFPSKPGDSTYYLVPSIVFTDPGFNPPVLKGTLTAPIKISNAATLPFANSPAPASDLDFTYPVRQLVDSQILHFIVPQPSLDACPAPQGASSAVTWSESFTSRVQVQDVWFTKDNSIVPVCGMQVGGIANYCPASCAPGSAEPCIVSVASCPVLRSDKATPAYLASRPLVLLDWSPVFGHDPDANGPNCHLPAPGDGNFQIHFGLKVVP